MGKVKFICGIIQCLTIKCVADKTAPDQLAIMGIGHQSVGRVHICTLAVFAEKTLFSIFMTIFYNMAAATVWAAGPVRQLLVYGIHSEHKVNDPI